MISSLCHHCNEYMVDYLIKLFNNEFPKFWFLENLKISLDWWLSISRVMCLLKCILKVVDFISCRVCWVFQLSRIMIWEHETSHFKISISNATWKKSSLNHNFLFTLSFLSYSTLFFFFQFLELLCNIHMWLPKNSSSFHMVSFDEKITMLTYGNIFHSFIIISSFLFLNSLYPLSILREFFWA